MTNYEDFYADEGCCLKCPDSYTGCLCFECKCTKCCWYISPYDNDGIKGKCGKINKIKEVQEFSHDLNNKIIEVETIKPEMFFENEI